VGLMSDAELEAFRTRILDFIDRYTPGSGP
jgi:hypothetical protein